MNEGARCYAWAQLRRSWRRRLVLVVALGVAGAVAIGSAAGAVRTNSAVDRFLTEQRAFDVLVFCGPLERDQGGFSCEQDLNGLDEIRDTTPILELSGLLTVAGRNIEPGGDDPCWNGPGDVKLVVSPDGRFGSAINAQRFIAGRPADASRPEEVAISRDLARRVGLHVGDTIDVQLFDGADCLGDPAEWRPPRTLTVVGIEVSPFEVRPESGEYVSFVHATPALLADVGELSDLGLMVAGRVRSDLQLEDLRAPFAEVGVSTDILDEEGQRFAAPQSLNSDNLQRSVRAQVTAQWLLGALTALTGLILLGQMLNRQLRRSATELRRLGHLGLTRRDLSTISLVHVLSVVVPAALVAVTGGYATSALTPLGVARVIEVDRGLRFDPVVLGLGTACMILALVLLAIPSIVIATRPRARVVAPRASRAGAVARGLGSGPVTTTGLRMAFEPSQGPAAPPLRTGFGMVLCAVVLLVGATVFAGSISHLLEAKHLIGWNFDALLYVDDQGDLDEPPTDERLREVLIATPGVVAVTPGTIFPPLLVLLGPDEQFTQLYAFGTGPVGPTLISGRAPSGPGEIVLGRETLSRLGRQEGDRMPFVARVGESDDPVPDGPTEFHGEVTIVGTAVLPAGGGDNRLGTGGALDVEFYNALVPGTQAGAAFVRLEPGAEVDDVAADAADRLGVGAVGSLTEESLGHDLLLRDVAQVRNLPIALAAMLALLAVGVVAQVIAGSVHARRGEIGVLRALGLRPSQIHRALVVQAVAVSGSVLVIGIPLGIVLGRAAWGAFALSLGTKPEVSLAVAWLAAMVVGLVVLASLFGLLGSARPRRQLAAALRRE